MSHTLATRVLLAIAVTSAAPALLYAQANTPHVSNTPPLVAAYTSHRVLNAVTVADDGRVFVSYPYWGASGTEQGPALAELGRDGVPHTYPDAAWNAWETSHDSDHSFVRLNAIRIGPDGNLWIVDSGEANVGGKRNPPNGAKAKLIVIGLHTNRVIRVISLATSSTQATYVDDIRFHENFAFLTDAGDPALIVLNLQSGEQRRVLEHADSTTDQRTMYAEGRSLMTNDKPARVHADQLEVSPDGSLLYFQPSSGPLYCIPTSALENWSLSGAERIAKVKLFANTPTTGGTAIDGDGNLYVTDVNRLRILKISPSGHTSTLISDKRLVWADAMWIAGDGKLWIPAVQLNRTAAFQPDGKSRVQQPITIFTLDLHLKPLR